MCRCTITCQTLEQAIFCARDFCLMLQPRAAGLCLEVSADVATFSMKTVRRQSSSAGCLLDLTGLLCFMHLFGWLIGRPLRPKSVFLAHPRRDDAGPFVGLFGAFVQFGAFASGFTFDAALLSRRVVRQPVELGKFLEDLPFGLVTRSSGSSSVTEKITGAIEASISNGDPLPGLAELAVMFDMSSVTLRRRLASEGTSYNELRSRCLGEAAKHYLRNTKWTIDEISGRLGFSSAAAFRRAFACWGNCSPTEYRRTFEAE
nr:helix-turn-helix domain-containing protein [Paraburkholderia sacchari]